MREEVIDGCLFSSMIFAGADNLDANRKLVNDLNVFPIPDGDTGDNMFMTIDSGADELSGEENGEVGTAAAAAARGMLLGARGNSGVILSRIFAGIADGLKGLKKADVETLSKAFLLGVDEAYGAVSKPVEGTILTVYKDAAGYADSRITDDSTILSYFDDFVKELRCSLERTPELLDVLKEAGVVDSGGAGFFYIAEGMRDVLSNGTSKAERSSSKTAAGKVDISRFTEDSELKFGYCTEVLIRLQRSKVDPETFDIKPLEAWLKENGDSVVIFKDGSIVKIHVHTMTPGQVLNYCQQFGEYLTIKIENMTLQHNEHYAKEEETWSKKPHKAFGLVSVAAGKGIKELFSSLGCDEVVDGGQSMNPSTEDFVNAFRKINADTIFVFPNNGNVILTANQAAQIYDKAEVLVVPSKTVGEGYAAISMFDENSGDAGFIANEMKEIVEGVITGMVSRASRDARRDGLDIRSGDYIGFAGDTVYVDKADRSEAAVSLCERLGAGNCDILLILRGEAVSEEEAERLKSELSEKYKKTEVIVMDGGQPVHDYIIVFE